ncbi:MAG: sulfotransferase domain-containing protein [Nitrososphaerales archaeon]
MHRVLNHLNYVTKVLLSRVHADRSLTVFPDDVFLVSYPRSGNTWTRFLVGNLVYPEGHLTFATLDSRIPPIYLFPNRVLRRISRPRILKSHECFDPKYLKTIYIVRDPRDVIVSLYYYLLKRGFCRENNSPNDIVARFLSEGYNNRRWGTWREHVLSWTTVRNGSEGFLLIRYEDLVADTSRELSKVARFLNIDASPSRLARAVELSSADRMRDLEQKESDQWQETKGTRRDIPFVRRAASGGWRHVLSQDTVAAIEEAWGPIMVSLGYELTSNPGCPSFLSSADNTVLTEIQK